MKAVTLCHVFAILVKFSEAQNIYSTLLPNDWPAITEDPWWCAASSLAPYMDAPKPTGALSSATLSFNRKIYDSCTLVGVEKHRFPFSDHPSWCGITTGMPSSLLTEYSSYGSVVSTWWASNSAPAVSAADECPNKWFDTMNVFPFGAQMLNMTIAFAGCHATAHETADMAFTAPIPTSTASPASTPSGGAPTSTSEPQTSVANAARLLVVGRTEIVEIWVAASTAIAAAVLNTIQ
ncbi:unnamed protein product [Discula destructiva]